MVFERDYYILSYVIQSRQRPKASAACIAISETLFILWDVMLPKREQLVPDELDGVFLLLFSKPLKKVRQQRDDVKAWLNAHPLPEPDSKQKREIYEEVNAMMMPLLKKAGFRSLAQLERHCEDEEARKAKM